MPGNGNQVRTGIIHRDFTSRLGCVRVKDDAMLTCNRCNFPHRLDSADLVVGMHHGDEDGLRRYGSFKFLEADGAMMIDRQPGDLKAFLFQKSANLCHSRMLDAAGDDVVSLMTVLMDSAFDGQVVGFAPTAGEDDLVGFTAQQGSYLHAGLLHCQLCRCSIRMAAGWIPEGVLKEWQHGFQHLGVNWRGSVIVEVDGVLHGLIFDVKIRFISCKTRKKSGAKGTKQTRKKFTFQHSFANTFCELCVKQKSIK